MVRRLDTITLLDTLTVMGISTSSSVVMIYTRIYIVAHFTVIVVLVATQDPIRTTVAMLLFSTTIITAATAAVFSFLPFGWLNVMIMTIQWHHRIKLGGRSVGISSIVINVTVDGIYLQLLLLSLSLL